MRDNLVSFWTKFRRDKKKHELGIDTNLQKVNWFTSLLNYADNWEVSLKKKKDRQSFVII